MNSPPPPCERLRVFVTRAIGARTNVYTDPEQRKLIYQLGLPPRRSATFLTLAASIATLLREGFAFASWSREGRFAYMVRIGELLDNYPAFRINDARKRNRTPGAPWQAILRWWLQAPDAIPPDASVVRDWLVVATSDFEFRLGAAINSTITNIWNSVHGNELVVPTLEEWRQVTSLPWAAFWLRDLLSWGTLEPVVAYLMSVSTGTSTVTTRQDAERFVQIYYDWHLEKYPDIETLDDFFSPLRMSEWLRSAFGESLRKSRPEPENFKAILRRDFPADSPEFYSVLPCELDDRIVWLDAAGYRLADSGKPSAWHEKYANRRDFHLNVRQRSIVAHEF